MKKPVWTSLECTHNKIINKIINQIKELSKFEYLIVCKYLNRLFLKNSSRGKTMERIILYYSDGGKTKVVAETLAINLRCDICQIKDMKKRDGIMNRFSSTIDAFRESKTEIYPPALDLEEYDTIYIGTPTWANNPTPAIITLIDRCDLRGKDIVLFTTTSTSDGESALEKMEMKVRARGARVVQQFSVKTKDKSLAQLQRDTDSLFVTLDLALY